MDGSKVDDSKGPGSLPLEGVRVLELCSFYAAPWIGKILCDWGATSVHVEDPGSGDVSRSFEPSKNGMSLGYARMNPGKKSICLDLRTSQGQAVVRRLVAQTDIVIDNFRPGRMAEWGLGFEDLKAVNASIIVVHLTGFGQTGPYAQKPGFSTIADAVSGFAHKNGWPDTPPTTAGFSLSDCLAGVAGAMGAIVSLVRLLRTGLPSEVDVALYEPIMTIMGDSIMHYSALGVVEGREGNGGAITAPRGVYHTADDKWLVASGSAHSTALRFLAAIGRPDLGDDPKFATNAARVEHRHELDAIIRAWMERHERDEIVEIFERHQVPIGPVNDPRDIVESKAFRERGSTVTMRSAELGDVVVPGRMFQLSGVPVSDLAGPASLGQHTDEVLTAAGYAADEIAALRAHGVVA